MTWRTTSQEESSLGSMANRNMAISGNNFTITNTIIDAFTSGGFPFNTDGFDVG